MADRIPGRGDATIFFRDPISYHPLMDFSHLSEPLMASMIGALATVAAALVQLRISWRREIRERERGQPITKKTRRGPVTFIFILALAASVAGLLSRNTSCRCAKATGTPCAPICNRSSRRSTRPRCGWSTLARTSASRSRPARGAPKANASARKARARASCSGVQARRRSRGEAGMHRAERAADRDLRKSAGVGDGQGSAALRARCEFQAAVGGSPGAGGRTRGRRASLTNSRSAPAATAARRSARDRELERRKIAHRPDPRQIRLVDPRRFPRISASMPPVTQTLLIANVAVFLLQSMSGGLLEEWFALWPPGHGSRSGSSSPTASCTAASRTFSSTCSGCTCSGATSNGCSARAIFSRTTLPAWSAPRSPSWCSLRSQAGHHPDLGRLRRTLRIAARLRRVFPAAHVILIFPPIPMQARFFVILFGGLELLFGVTGTAAGVAHFAHLGGMLGGWLAIQYRAGAFLSRGGAEAGSHRDRPRQRRFQTTL